MGQSPLLGAIQALTRGQVRPRPQATTRGILRCPTPPRSHSTVACLLAGQAPEAKPAKTDLDAMLQPWGPLGEYLVNAAQRIVLFWDVLRWRSDQYYEQKAKAVPNVLSFGSELILDGSTFERLVNSTGWCGPRRSPGWSSIRRSAPS